MANKYLFYTNAGLIRTGENAPVSDVQFSISKNNNEVDTFYINIQDYDYTNSYATITATLPDETETPAIVMTPTDFQKDGVTYKGFKYIVKQAFTSIAGIETLTFRIKSNTDDSLICMSRLVVTIVDNDTPSDPTITTSQYDELLTAMSLAYSGEVIDGTEEMPTYMLDKDNGFYKFKSGAYMNLPYLKDGVLTDRIIYNNSSKDIPIMYGLTDEGVYSLFGYFTTETITLEPVLINMEFDNKVVFATTQKVYTTDNDLTFNHKYYVSGKINNSNDVGNIDIYAPTTAGTTGNVLKSTGGTPTWGTLENLQILRSGFFVDSYNGSAQKQIDIPLIVDNLYSNDDTATLSAKQGSMLRQMIVSNRYGTGFATIEDMVNELVVSGKDLFMQWSNLYIVDTEVPDFWITSIEDESVIYRYTTDEDLINAVKSEPLQIGYYKISLLETEKVDLSDYVKKTTKINNHSLNADVTITKSDVGLGNVDNTADLDKPISTATQTALNNKQNTITNSNKLSASLVSGLGAVATSNNYNDLNNKPTINNSTITIQKNGTDVDTFSTNASSNKTINITDVASANSLTKVINNTTIISNNYGGFSGGTGSEELTGGGAIGYNSLTANNTGINYGGGAVGKVSTATNGGGAIGHGASAYNGGFAGGLGAVANGDYDEDNQTLSPNIQLGEGTNNTPKTLQVFNDNIYNANTHTLNVTNATFTNTPTINGSNVAKVSDIPTNNNQLINGSNFITNAVNDLANYYLKSETYTKNEVDGLISAIPKFAIRVVNSLPTTDISSTTIYLLTTGDESQNLYTEYIYTNNAWEKLGTQSVDLSDYSTTAEMNTAISTALQSYYNKSSIDSLLSNKANTTDLPTKTSDLTNDGDGTSNFATESYVQTNGGKIDTISVNGVNQTIINKNVNISVPTQLSQLTDDATHRIVTDTEKANWNGKAEISDIPTDNADLTNGAGYQTSSDVSTAITTNNTNIVTPIANRVSAIEGKIPSEASSSNQLADKSFVNSSISTATATFRGTFNTLVELQATSGDLNDYAFLVIYDSAQSSQVKQYDKYKHNGTGWVFEYTLNNSSFTQAQWNAINSGITSALVTQIGTNASNITSLNNNKQNNITSSNKLASDLIDDSNQVNKFVTSTDISNWNNKQEEITSSNKLNVSLISGLSTIATTGNLSDGIDDSTHRLVTDAEKTTWSNKQNAITSSNKLSTDLISGLSSVAISGEYSDLLNKPYSIQDISDQNIYIANLDTGIYRLTYAGDKTIYYYTNKSFNVYYQDSKSIPLLFVSMGRPGSTSYGNETGWLLLESGNLHTGRTTSSVGEHNGYNLGENNRWITKGRVINNLNYSTSDTDYVLSAYQGYLLGQNKQDKLDYTITSTDISITEVD